MALAIDDTYAVVQTTGTITVPDTVPVGALLVLIMQNGNGSTITAPEGYTLFADTGNVYVGNYLTEMTIYSKIATSEDPGSTIDVTGDGQFFNAQVFALNALGLISFELATASGSSLTPAVVTATGPEQYALAAFSSVEYQTGTSQTLSDSSWENIAVGNEGNGGLQYAVEAFPLPLSGESSSGGEFEGGGYYGGVVALTILVDAIAVIYPTSIGGLGFDSLLTGNPDITHWWPLVGDASPDSENSGWVFPDLIGDASFTAEAAGSFLLVPGLPGSAYKASQTFAPYAWAYTTSSAIQPKGYDFALSVWFKLSETPSRVMPLLCDTEAYQSLMLTPTGVAFAQYDNGWSQVAATVEPTLGDWHHLMVSVFDDTGELSIFLDGETVATGYGTHNPQSDGFYLGYGYYYEYGWTYFDPTAGTAQYAHATIYEHAQSAVVASAQYAAGRSLAGLATIGSPSVEYGDFHLSPNGIYVPKIGAPSCVGGGRAGNPIGPMLVRRGGLGR